MEFNKDHDGVEKYNMEQNFQIFRLPGGDSKFKNECHQSVARKGEGWTSAVLRKAFQSVGRALSPT